MTAPAHNSEHGGRWARFQVTARRCPTCQETQQRSATRCRHCTTVLVPELRQRRQPEDAWCLQCRRVKPHGESAYCGRCRDKRRRQLARLESRRGLTPEEMRAAALRDYWLERGRALGLA